MKTKRRLRLIQFATTVLLAFTAAVSALAASNKAKIVARNSNLDHSISRLNMLKDV